MKAIFKEYKKKDKADEYLEEYWEEMELKQKFEKMMKETLEKKGVEEGAEKDGLGANQKKFKDFKETESEITESQASSTLKEKKKNKRALKAQIKKALN